MEEATGAAVTRPQAWPPAPGAQVTQGNGAKPGAGGLTHLLAGAGLNGSSITMVSDNMGGLLVTERGNPSGEFLQTIQLPPNPKVHRWKIK